MVQWGEGVRLKNLQSNKYLTSSAQLVDDRAPETLMRLVNLTNSEADQSGAKAVPFKGFLYITSFSGSAWLALQGSAVATKDKDDADNTEIIPVSVSAFKVSVFGV